MEKNLTCCAAGNFHIGLFGCRRLGSLEVREMTRTISNPPTTSTNNQPNHQPTNLSINQPTNQTNKQTNKQCQETEPEAMANTIYCVFFWEPTPPDSSPSSIACRRCRVWLPVKWQNPWCLTHSSKQLGSTRMSMELSNYLVSWVVLRGLTTYLHRGYNLFTSYRWSEITRISRLK